MPAEELKRELQRHFPFWSGLSPAEQDLLLSHSSPAVFRRGETLHGSGNDCLGVILVENGTLRAYMLSDEGREITLYRLYPGDTCVLMASCVLDYITFEVHMDAESDTQALIVSPGAFARLSEHNLAVENFSYKLAAERFSDVMWAMQQILFMSFDRRLAIFLVDELSKTKGDTIRMTHEQVAKYVGSAREVVSRMLKYFAEEGIVSLSRGGIKILDREKLRRLTR